MGRGGGGRGRRARGGTGGAYKAPGWGRGRVRARWRRVGAPARRSGLGLVGQGADELLDALGVVAAVAAEGAPVRQAALAGPAGDRLGRDVQPAGDLVAGQ